MVMGLHDGYVLPYRFLWDQMVETEDHHAYATCHYLVFPNTIFLFQPAINTLNIMLAWPTWWARPSSSSTCWPDLGRIPA